MSCFLLFIFLNRWSNQSTKLFVLLKKDSRNTRNNHTGAYLCQRRSYFADKKASLHSKGSMKQEHIINLSSWTYEAVYAHHIHSVPVLASTWLAWSLISCVILALRASIVSCIALILTRRLLFSVCSIAFSWNMSLMLSTPSSSIILLPFKKVNVFYY